MMIYIFINFISLEKYLKDFFMKREIWVLRVFNFYYLLIICMYNRYMYIWFFWLIFDWDSLVLDVISVFDWIRYLRLVRLLGLVVIGLMNCLY